MVEGCNSLARGEREGVAVEEGLKFGQEKQKVEEGLVFLAEGRRKGAVN